MCTFFKGMHLAKLGITVEDTRDKEGRARFLGYNINTMLSPGKLSRKTNYFKQAIFPVQEVNVIIKKLNE